MPGYNHFSNCSCGWCNGSGYGQYGSGAYTPSNTEVFTPFLWKLFDSDYTRQTNCPRCHKLVYFVRHNGGSVWLDDLGWPWPKHHCFCDDISSDAFHKTIEASHSTSEVIVKNNIGVIVAVECRPARSGDSERFHLYLLVHYLDDNFVTVVIGGRHNPKDLLGEIIVFSKRTNQIIYPRINQSHHLGIFQSDRLTNSPSNNYRSKTI